MLAAQPYAAKPQIAPPSSEAAPLGQPHNAIDWHYLHEVSAGNSEYEQEILQVLMSVLPAYVQTLKAGINAGDCYQVEQTAHLIKGSTSSVGARSSAAIAGCLEKQASQKQLDHLAQLFLQLKAALVSLQKEVDRTLALPH